LSHMFRMGAAPDVVVLVLNPIQLTSRAIDGDYSAHFLVDRRDLTSLANDIGADRDKMSSLALANVSFFYATRAEIRTWILGRILPDLPSFTHLLYVAPTLPSGNAFPRTATQRLIQLRELCETYGVQVVLVIPPAVEDSGAATVLRAAKESGVKVLNPIGPAILPASDYSDNFHLNSRGAGKFTPALASALKETLLSAALQSKSRSRDDSARETGATAFPWNLEDHAMEAVNAAQGR